MAWNDRGHFLAVAAQVMRFILVDYARRRRAPKRGGDLNRVTLSEAMVVADASFVDVLDLDAALTRLDRIDPRKARVAALRLFTGASVEEMIAALGVSEATVMRDWRFARAWLQRNSPVRQEGRLRRRPRRAAPTHDVTTERESFRISLQGRPAPCCQGEPDDSHRHACSPPSLSPCSASPRPCLAADIAVTVDTPFSFRATFTGVDTDRLDHRRQRLPNLDVRLLDRPGQPPRRQHRWQRRGDRLLRDPADPQGTPCLPIPTRRSSRRSSSTSLSQPGAAAHRRVGQFGTQRQRIGLSVDHRRRPVPGQHRVATPVRLPATPTSTATLRSTPPEKTDEVVADAQGAQGRRRHHRQGDGPDHQADQAAARLSVSHPCRAL